ncbi:MAG: glycosyltransferase [Lachnospiraceae bacterium]|nr:glycosyltransferase [Lachnospiraceae bacterium]
MDIISAAKRSIGYMSRNGVRAGILEISESMSKTNPRGSDYREPTDYELSVMRRLAESLPLRPLISVVVPAYNTDEKFFRDMAESVLAQAYEKLELIIADASEDKTPLRSIADSFEDKRVRYIPLAENKGISINTNAALDEANGDYIALLDHDDLLTPDALLRVVENIISYSKRCGKHPDVLYSDEDKVLASGGSYTERNSKPDFDPVLLLNNNYICHLTVMKSSLMKKLRFREKYDGAQDYDILLRALSEGAGFSHIPQILYHWRISPASTASNTAGKLYAYDAGSEALLDYGEKAGFEADVYGLRNVGYYEFRYKGDALASRKDMGAIGGRIVSGAHRGRVIGGKMDKDGNLIYGGLPVGYTGYFHRAMCQQTAEALDIRCIRISPEFWDDFYKITGVKYSEHRTPGMLSLRPHETGRPPQDGEKVFDAATLPEDADIKQMSLELSAKIRESGKGLLYYPCWQVTGR